MQVVENWAQLRGEVLEYVPDPKLPSHIIARVQVGDIQLVEGFPNLFHSSAGEVLEVKLPASNSPPPVGSTVSWRIRRGGPQSIFVHPDSLT